MSKSKPTLKWNIIRKAENGLYYLEIVELESGCSGEVVFEQIQRLCLPKRNSCSLSHRGASLLYSPVVYTTTVIKVRELKFLSAHGLTFARDVTRLRARISKSSLRAMKSS
jgi:hypothetical protein